MYIDAGRVVFDALTGEVISATPNPLSQDYAALVCATLARNRPASRRRTGAHAPAAPAAG